MDVVRGGWALLASFSQCNFFEILANLWAAHANAGLVGENGMNKGGFCACGSCGWWCVAQPVGIESTEKSTAATRHAPRRRQIPGVDSSGSCHGMEGEDDANQAMTAQRLGPQAEEQLAVGPWQSRKPGSGRWFDLSCPHPTRPPRQGLPQNAALGILNERHPPALDVPVLFFFAYS